MDFRFKVDKVNDRESENYFNSYKHVPYLSFSSETSLGQGGFGKTWKISIGKNDFAIKIFKAPLMAAYEDEPQVPYENEFQVLKTLGGAEGHSPKVFACGKVYFPEEMDPLPAIIMEYMSGMPLQTRVESQNGSGNSSCLDLLAGGNGLLLGSEQVLNIVQQAALASDACFQKGVNSSLGVHRDLSPDNIIVEVDKDHRTVRKVSFIDWGSSPKEKGFITPACAARFGKVLFSSPEIFFGGNSSNRTDITVDIYSIGLLAFWLRTREYPLATELKQWCEVPCINTSDFSKIDEIKRDYKVDLVRWIKQSGGKVTWWDKKLSALIAECTQYEPKERPQTPSELARRADVVQKLIDDIYKVSSSDDEIRSVADEVGLEVKIVGRRADDSWNLKYAEGMEDKLEEVYNKLAAKTYNKLVAKTKEVSVANASRVTPSSTTSRALGGKMLPKLGPMFHGVKRLRRLGPSLYGLLVLATLAVTLADRITITNQLMHIVSISLCVFVACLSIVFHTIITNSKDGWGRVKSRVIGIMLITVCISSVAYGSLGIVEIANGQWHAQVGDAFVQSAGYLEGDEKKDMMSRACDYIQQSADKENGDGLALLAERYYLGDAAIEHNTSKAIDVAKRSRDKGSACGKAVLARCYFFGDSGIQPNYDLAFSLAKESVEENDKRGMYVLGRCYYGNHVPSDAGSSEEDNKKKALDLFTRGAEQSYAPTECYAGICLYDGVGTEKSNEHDRQAFRYFQQASAQHHRNAMARMGDCYYYGRGDNAVDYNEAKKWYEKAYDYGDAYGTYRLALLYYQGISLNGDSVITKDPNKAFELSKISAEWGNNSGKALLGKCYLYGIGCQKNEDEAVKIFNDLDKVDFGYGEALLGDCYYYGWGKNKNTYEAVRLYEEATGHNDPYGEARLGFCLFYGIGNLGKNREDAFSHFLAAADAGQSWAYAWVAYCYHYGYGIGQDYDHAYRYAQRAGDENDTMGQRMMGICHYYGHGVEQDKKTAYKWFETASTDDFAKVWLGRCRLDMGSSKAAVECFTQVKDDKSGGYGARSEATAWLSYCRLHGSGIEFDHVVAFNLLNGISEDEHTSFSLELLGECYYWGYGTQVDESTAIDLFNRVIQTDDSDDKYELKYTENHGCAYCWLGYAYHDACGVAKNDSLAKEMLRRAVLSGDDFFVWSEDDREEEGYVTIAKKRLAEWYGLEVSTDGSLQSKSK